jgi:hypothetical protein
MSRRVASLLLVLLLLGLSLGSALAQKEEPAVKISPNTINTVGDRSGRKLTVHANVPYTSVVPDTVTLRPVGCEKCDGLKPKSTFPDDQGDLVAKFRMGEVLTELILPESQSAGTITLELTVDRQVGDRFSGTDDIQLVTCRRAAPGARFPEASGAFKWGRSFSRVCEPEGPGGG